MRYLYLFCLACSLFRCANPPTKPPINPMDYFELINTKSEKVGERTNTMELYAPKSDSIHLDALKALCKSRKTTFEKNFFSYLVVFDSKKNADFPKTPFTGFYGSDGSVKKHIKSHYDYCSKNGYSKLFVAYPNCWEGIPTELSID